LYNITNTMLKKKIRLMFINVKMTINNLINCKTSNVTRSDYFLSKCGHEIPNFAWSTNYILFL